jgi:LAO/AO transport system kinase
MGEGRKPEWMENETEHTTSSILSGKGHSTGEFKQKRKPSRPVMSVEQLTEGVLRQDRATLARAITLIESQAAKHYEVAQQLLQRVLPHTGSSIRIGISGVPGAGKSTFIEAFGLYLCEKGYKVAVLAVDPSSSVSGGSILGDKTRMEQLSRHPNAFIRPSPSGGTLGGVHRKTRETMLLCEAAGFDVILIETVGVGQSEIIVRSMVDFFLLLVLTGAGDELQGMKKGIMEIADAILVNKADGSNLPLAKKTKEEYNQLLHFLQPATKGWETRAYTCSALTGDGIEDVWKVIQRFVESTKESNVFFERRKEQAIEWMYTMIHDRLHTTFFQHPRIQELLPDAEQSVKEGTDTVTSVVDRLFSTFTDS